ncbi:hypothetical protein [Candidatus Xianfuyuplasma coldseepsis]|uniref:YokE-like PH domain-containing protein n=1 Tax=Candidatus Xianfuyuplasma coldseepsis TaxID=2782163 RepID=A0A7L7KT74_9MOLU|nr:hypothetical protein [Xianfuyuplasma coldseepsis]QMS85154.1 hypothetical protein G4Z02_05140 [Xianfuyuplasma coldseepsis]
MEKIRMIPHTKQDMKELESYLRNNDLLDDEKIWFAGFPVHRGAEQNAIAANLFYGNKRLKIVTVKEDTIYFLHNHKNEFSVNKLGTVSHHIKVQLHWKVLHPIIEITTPNEDDISLQINKNKEQLKVFKNKMK